MSNPDYSTALQLFFVLGIAVVFLVIFAKPLMGFAKVLFRAGAYSCLIYIANIITASFGFTLGLNFFSSALCGFLGIYGLLLAYITRFLY